MAKLPWYVKDNGFENIGGQLFVNIKIRRIYIIWVKIQVFFTMLFDRKSKSMLIPFIAFALFTGTVYLICFLADILLKL